MHRAGHQAPVLPGDTALGRDTALGEGMALLSGSVGRQRKQAGDLLRDVTVFIQMVL